MPTLDDVYRKFGQVSETAQLIETDIGTLLLFHSAVADGVITPDLKADGKRATELLNGINRQTLGQLIRNTKRHTEGLTQLEPMLTAALEEGNLLFHHFYRQHNFRKCSEEGRAIMLQYLEDIHDTLTDAFKALNLLQGIDLEAIVEQANKAGEGR